MRLLSSRSILLCRLFRMCRAVSRDRRTTHQARRSVGGVACAVTSAVTGGSGDGQPPQRPADRPRPAARRWAARCARRRARYGIGAPVPRGTPHVRRPGHRTARTATSRRAAGNRGTECGACGRASAAAGGRARPASADAGARRRAPGSGAQRALRGTRRRAAFGTAMAARTTGRVGRACGGTGADAPHLGSGTGGAGAVSR